MSRSATLVGEDPATVVTSPVSDGVTDGSVAVLVVLPMSAVVGVGPAVPEGSDVVGTALGGMDVVVLAGSGVVGGGVLAGADVLDDASDVTGSVEAVDVGAMHGLDVSVVVVEQSASPLGVCEAVTRTPSGSRTTASTTAAADLLALTPGSVTTRCWLFPSGGSGEGLRSSALPTPPTILTARR